MCEIMQAFETRLKQMIKWLPIKPSKTDRIIKQMEDGFEEWTRSNTREVMWKNADKFFTENINEPTIQEDSRN